MSDEVSVPWCESCCLTNACGHQSSSSVFPLHLVTIVRMTSICFSGRLVGFGLSADVMSSGLKSSPSSYCLGVLDSMSIWIRCIGIESVNVRWTLSAGAISKRGWESAAGFSMPGTSAEMKLNWNALSQKFYKFGGICFIWKHPVSVLLQVTPMMSFSNPYKLCPNSSSAKCIGRISVAYIVTCCGSPRTKSYRGICYIGFVIGRGIVMNK